MEPIRLCRHKESGPYGVWWPGDPAGEGGDFDYLLALPRADFDAREARLARAEQERDEARRALSGHLFDGESLSLREAIRSEMLKDYVRAINARDAATARADKAEALLREARDSVVRDDTRNSAEMDALLARIDAALEEKK